MGVRERVDRGGGRRGEKKRRRFLHLETRENAARVRVCGFFFLVSPLPSPETPAEREREREREKGFSASKTKTLGFILGFNFCFHIIIIIIIISSGLPFTQGESAKDPIGTCGNPTPADFQKLE